MNEKKKLLVIVGVLVAIVIFVIAFTIARMVNDKKLYEKFEQAYAGDKPTLVYIGKPGCQFCSLLNPSLQDMAERYDFEYIYFDIKNYSASYFNKVMDKLKIKEVGTPYLAIVGNNGVVNTQNGYIDYDKLFEFLQKNKVIDEKAELPINYIGLKEYKELLASNKPQLVVVGQSQCMYCVNAKVALNNIAEKYKIDINYLNITYLSDSEGKEFTNSLSYLSENNWGTPLMMIVKDNKLVARYNGFSGINDYISFLEEQGVI